MAGNRIICVENNIDYSTIRKAMCEGARTVEDVKEKAGICGECSGCESDLGAVLSSVCGCKQVSLEAVVNAVKNGADTVDKVGEITEAGTAKDCGRCKALIANIIELGY